MIYLLEDDASIRELVCYSLSKTGTEAVGFGTPSEFRKALETRIPELILLDIMLPEQDGISLLLELRTAKNTRHTPIIMLTAKDSEYDKVRALDSGADDYITKPFGVMELIARVHAVLRRSRSEGSAESVYQIGELSVSVLAHTVTVCGEEIILTHKEFDLLAFLLANRGTVLTRDRILNEVWGYEFDGENRTVDVHIRTLRQKLGTAGERIETVRGVGYKISGDL